jgi:hypothetical protein
VDRDPHQFTFEDLVNSACNFSGDNHPGLYLLLLLDVLTTLDVLKGQILRYDAWAIPSDSRLIETFAFILLKKQIYLIQSTVPVQFLCFQFRPTLIPPGL